jgi:hypothetical protein
MLLAAATLAAVTAAGNASRNTGSVVAAWTSAAISGDGVSSVMSQPAPTFCNQVPIFDVSEAIHKARKTGRRNGAYAEPSPADVTLVAPWLFPIVMTYRHRFPIE